MKKNRRPATDYVETILSPKSWGGAIELAILSDHYQAEIMSFDVQTGRVDKFGEGSGYQNCVLIVYSGIRDLSPSRSSSRSPLLNADEILDQQIMTP